MFECEPGEMRSARIGIAHDERDNRDVLFITAFHRLIRDRVRACPSALPFISIQLASLPGPRWI